MPIQGSEAVQLRTILVLSALAVAARQLFIERGTIGNKIVYLFSIIVCDISDEYRETHLLRDTTRQVPVKQLIQKLRNERVKSTALAMLAA